MTFSFSQIVMMLLYMIVYMILIYIMIYRKFKRFLLEQQFRHEQAVGVARIHHDESSLSSTDKLKD